MNDLQRRKLVENVCRKLFRNSLLTESDTSELNKELQDKLIKIKTKDDLKKFMQDNAEEIKASYEKADKKSKPFYRKAWDWLCGAAKSTANFIGNNLGSILLATGVLYAGHAIGFNNIKSFFTGRDEKERKKADATVNAMNNTAANAIKAVADIKTELTPEQQKRVLAIRSRLPNEKDILNTMDFKSAVTGLVNPDKALRIDAERARKSQLGSASHFMETLDQIIKKNPKYVDTFLDKIEGVLDKKR